MEILYAKFIFINECEQEHAIDNMKSHVLNFGRMVEDMEGKLRSHLNEIYFGKTRDIFNGLRSSDLVASKAKNYMQAQIFQNIALEKNKLRPDEDHSVFQDHQGQDQDQCDRQDHNQNQDHYKDQDQDQQNDEKDKLRQEKDGHSDLLNLYENND